MVVQFLVLGIINGGVYALIAVGLSLLFGVIEVINVSHGEWITLGGYLGVLFLGTLSANPVLGLIGSGVGVGLVGVSVYFLFIAPLRRRIGKRPSGSTYLVLTLGLSMLLQNATILVASPNFRRIPPFASGTQHILGVIVQNQRLVIFGCATFLLVAFFLFLKKTKLGMAIRAVGQNPTAAVCSGISLHAVFAACFAIAGITTGIGGALIGSTLRVYPTMGFELLLKGFAVIIIAGMKNLAGALVVAYVIGICESLGVMVLPMEWKSAIAFVLMVVVLIARPKGVFSKPDPV